MQKLAVCVHNIAEAQMVTKFLSNIRISDGKAENIVSAVEKLCKACVSVMNKPVG